MKPTALKDVSSKRPPLSDIKTLRERARQHIEKGAVTSGCAADRDNVIKMLNEALATENYREMIAYLGDQDPTTHRMLEEILASEEEHAEDLSSLLEGMKDYGKV